MEGPEQLNVAATRGLVEALRSAGVCPLVLHLSSAAVYGDRSGLWLEEDMPLLPHTDYGRAKAAAEALLREAERKGLLRLRVLRPGPVYGPGFPFLMVDRLRRGLGWLPGEGRNYLPVVHVVDAVRAALAVLDRGRDGAIYNIADQAPPTSRDFYARVAELLGVPPPRYWSTWVPSAVQHRVAGLAARGAARLGQRPPLTSDALRMATASARLNVDLLREELGFHWTYPRSQEGIAASLQDPLA
jgi:nucleoside-diphosphate-sugar epimerase